MRTNTQKQLAQEHVGNNTPYTFDSVEESIAEVKRLICWLEYVAENEYNDVERKLLISVSKRFAELVQPIANKYLD